MVTIISFVATVQFEKNCPVRDFVPYVTMSPRDRLGNQIYRDEKVPSIDGIPSILSLGRALKTCKKCIKCPYFTLNRAIFDPGSQIFIFFWPLVLIPEFSIEISQASPFSDFRCPIQCIKNIYLHASKVYWVKF